MDPTKADATNGKSGDSPDSGKIDLSGVTRRGPGRPPGSGKKTAENPAPRKPSPEPVSLADAEFVAETFVSIIEIGDELLQNRLLAIIAKQVPAKTEEFQELQKAVRFGARDKDLVKRCLIRIAQKYAFLGRFAPELLLLGVLAQYGLRQARLFKFVETMAEEAKKQAGTIQKIVAEKAN
jgi:hypothetical protein